MNPDDETVPADTVDAPLPGARSGAIPATVGRFQIEAKLGEGGMGVVLLATDPLLGRRVAIKVLRGSAIDDSARRRLLREAQATAQLSHENVIVVHEVGTHEDQVYLAMEYVAGQTLTRHQADRGWRVVLDLYTRAGRGLQAAHDAGLVHRDFKPDNVLVGADGRLRVTDFGLVAATDAVPESPGPRDDSELASKLTQTGAVMGTPRYMAPEQHRGEQVDTRADQFAFCVALYEALYGQAPFAGTTYAELVANVVDAKLTPLPASEVPLDVRDAVLRGLDRERNNRHGSMRDLLALLAIAPPSQPRRRWPLAIGLAAGVAAVAAVALLVTERSGGSAARPVVEAATSRLDITTFKKALPAFDEGERSYRTQKYDDAERSFEEAYAALRVPQLLANIGASLYMKAKRDGDAATYRRAADAYTRYLASDPMAPGIAEAIEAITGEVERLEGGGARDAPSPAIRELANPEVRGFAVLISNPSDATVYVDDVSRGPVGTTPWAGTLGGEHTIYTAKPGYRQSVLTFTFNRHKPMVVNALLTEMGP
jgi:hypothetical protein